MKISSSIGFLKCRIDNILGVIFIVRNSGMTRGYTCRSCPFEDSDNEWCSGVVTPEQASARSLKSQRGCMRATVLPLRSLTATNFIPHFLACAMTILSAPNKHFSIVYRKEAKFLSAWRNGVEGIGCPMRIKRTITASYKSVAKPSRSVSLNVSQEN
jgi:hypothetical protein